MKFTEEGIQVGSHEIPNSPWGALGRDNLVMMAEVGSGAHGIALEGKDDYDLMGVSIPDPAPALGVQRPPTHYVYRTAPKDERSQPGDVDLTVYTLRRYAELVSLKANPTAQLLLWVRPDRMEALGHPGRRLRSLREELVTQRLGKSFLGYMRSQRERLEGKRGQKNVKRPELVEAHGYDTKYASHLLRLGYQGVEMVEKRRLTIPMQGSSREIVLQVKRGDADLGLALRLARALEKRIEKGFPGLPEHPPLEKINDLLVRAHLELWWYQ